MKNRQIVFTVNFKQKIPNYLFSAPVEEEAPTTTLLVTEANVNEPSQINDKVETETPPPPTPSMLPPEPAPENSPPDQLETPPAENPPPPKSEIPPSVNPPLVESEIPPPVVNPPLVETEIPPAVQAEIPPPAENPPPVQPEVPPAVCPSPVEPEVPPVVSPPPVEDPVPSVVIPPPVQPEVPPVVSPPPVQPEVPPVVSPPPVQPEVPPIISPPPVQPEVPPVVSPPPVQPEVPPVISPPPVQPEVPPVVSPPPVQPEVPPVISPPPVQPEVPPVVSPPPVQPEVPPVISPPPVQPEFPPVISPPAVQPEVPPAVGPPPVQPEVPPVASPPPVEPEVPPVVCPPPVQPEVPPGVSPPPVQPQVPPAVAPPPVQPEVPLVVNPPPVPSEAPIATSTSSQLDSTTASDVSSAPANQDEESGVDTSSIDEGFHKAVLELERKKMEQTKTKPPLEKDLPEDFQSALKNFGEPVKMSLKPASQFNVKSPSNESLHFRPIKMSAEKLKRLETKSCENLLDEIANEPDTKPPNYHETRQRYGLAVATKRRAKVPEPVKIPDQSEAVEGEEPKTPVDYKDARNRFGEAVKTKQIPGTPPNEPKNQAEIVMPKLRATPKPDELKMSENGQNVEGAEEPKVTTPVGFDDAAKRFGDTVKRATPNPASSNQNGDETKSEEGTPFGQDKLRPTGQAKQTPELDEQQKAAGQGQPLHKSYQQARHLFEATPEKSVEVAKPANGNGTGAADHVDAHDGNGANGGEGSSNIYTPGYQTKLALHNDSTGMKIPPEIRRAQLQNPDGATTPGQAEPEVPGEQTLPHSTAPQSPVPPPPENSVPPPLETPVPPTPEQQAPAPILPENVPENQPAEGTQAQQNPQQLQTQAESPAQNPEATSPQVGQTLNPEGASEIPEAITNLTDDEKNVLINALLQKEGEPQSM